MKNIRNYILETFSSFYDYELEGRKQESDIYSFSSKNNNKYFVIINWGASITKGPEVSFEDEDNNIKITNAGDAYKVLATVGKIIYDYFKELPNYDFFLTASRHEESRVRLWDRLTIQLAKNLNRDCSKVRTGDSYSYLFSKKWED